MDPLDAETWKYLTSEVLLGAVAVKGGAVALAVALTGVCLRDRVSAATRSALWAGGFGALLLLPLLIPVVAGRLPPALELGLARYPEGLFVAPAATEGPAGAGGIPPAVWLGVAWAAGAAGLLGRFALHVARIARVSHRATPVREGPLAEAAREAGRDMGVGHVRVALSDCPGVPLTWGLFRPVVLLPREAPTWGAGLQRAVLRHEVAHAARMDYLGLVAMELARAVHWPNPLVWHLTRRYRMDQERACDDAAIRSGITAPDYARHLVSVARAFVSRSESPASALPVARRSSLGERVRAIMDRSASRGPATGLTVTASLLLTATLSVSLAMANPWDCAGEESAALPRAADARVQEPTLPSFVSLAAGAAPATGSGERSARAAARRPGPEASGTPPARSRPEESCPEPS